MTSQDDIALIRVVAEDLRSLQVEWTETAQDDKLRRESTVLRRLLVNGDYPRAWRTAGLDRGPTVVTTDLDKQLEVWGTGAPDYAQASGATYGGATVAHVVSESRAYTPEEVAARYKRGKAVEDQILSRRYTIKELLRSPAIVVKGTRITRSEVIKYAANKLGGAHYDSNRSQGEKLYQELDRAMREWIVGGKVNVYSELLAIGQALAKSPDTQVFLDRAHELGV